MGKARQFSTILIKITRKIKKKRLMFWTLIKNSKCKWGKLKLKKLKYKVVRL